MHRSPSSPKVETLGISERFLEFQEQLSRVAPVERPVLLMGERGTGKELAAKAIHNNSPRRDKPFVTVNSGSLPPDLLESNHDFFAAWRRGEFQLPV